MEEKQEIEVIQSWSAPRSLSASLVYSFAQHMAKQRVPGLTDELMKKGKHFILVNNPLDILPSFDKVVPPSFLELRLADLVCIYSELCELRKPPPAPIIDAAELQHDPEAALHGPCEDLDIHFQAAMLQLRKPFSKLLIRNGMFDNSHI